MKENYLAVIPAAGKGTRAMCLTGYGAILKPFINATEKGSTVLEETVKEIICSGLNEISIIVNGDEDEKIFRKFFSPFEADPSLKESLTARNLQDDINFINTLSSLEISYFAQPVANGFGDAIAKVYPKVNANKDFNGIVVILGDDLVFSKTPGCRQLISAHKQTGSMIVGVQEVSYEDAKKFGVVLIDTDNGMLDLSDDFNGKAAYRVTGVEEKPKNPAPNIVEGRKRYYAVLGRYVLNRDDISFLAGEDGTMQKELDFTSLFQKNIREQKLIAVDIEGEWHTVGSSLAAQMAQIKYGISQYGKNGDLSNDGKKLALYAIKVMRENGILTEKSEHVFELAKDMKGG